MDKPEDPQVNSDQSPAKPKRSRAPRSLKKTNLDQLQKKFLTSLNREADHLLDESFKGKLEKDDAQSLNNYLKLLKDLKKEEDEALSNLSDEQLAQLARTKDE